MHFHLMVLILAGLTTQEQKEASPQVQVTVTVRPQTEIRSR